jgi:hypothetical protein
MAAYASKPASTIAAEWIRDKFEVSEGSSVLRSSLQDAYKDHCTALGLRALNDAGFGKVLRQLFPELKSRRLGTRGNSRYHYYGMRPRSDSGLNVATTDPVRAVAHSSDLSRLEF